MYRKYIKRLLDIFFASILFIILLPLFIIVALLVKLTSKGPVFYKGMRAGYQGKTIYIYKFRSMVANADAIGGDLAIGHDDRITSFGRFMRITKLDEIPQLLNILKGEMSFIGPRPELVRCAQNFTGEELKIFDVKPGLSDFSSIYFVDMEMIVNSQDIAENYEKSILKVKNKLRLKYEREISFFTDFKILVMTGLVILMKMFHLVRHKYPRSTGKQTVLFYCASTDDVYCNHAVLLQKLTAASYHVYIVSTLNDRNEKLEELGCKIINYKQKKMKKGFAKAVNYSLLPDTIISYGTKSNIILGKSVKRNDFTIYLNLSSADIEIIKAKPKMVQRYMQKATAVFVNQSSDEFMAFNSDKVILSDNPDELMYASLVKELQTV